MTEESHYHWLSPTITISCYWLPLPTTCPHTNREYLLRMGRKLTNVTQECFPRWNVREAFCWIIFFLSFNSFTLVSNFIWQFNNWSTRGSHFPCLMSVWIELLRGLQDVRLVRTAPSRIALSAPKFYAFSAQRKFYGNISIDFSGLACAISFKFMPCFRSDRMFV